MKILFFGQLADQIGREREVDVPADGCTVAELRRLLSASDARLAHLLGRPGIRAAVDREIALEDALVSPTQEVAFFSPVSGG